MFSHIWDVSTTIEVTIVLGWDETTQPSGKLSTNNTEDSTSVKWWFELLEPLCKCCAAVWVVYNRPYGSMAFYGPEFAPLHWFVATTGWIVAIYLCFYMLGFWKTCNTTPDVYCILASWKKKRFSWVAIMHQSLGGDPKIVQDWLSFFHDPLVRLFPGSIRWCSSHLWSRGYRVGPPDLIPSL